MSNSEKSTEHNLCDLMHACIRHALEIFHEQDSKKKILKSNHINGKHTTHKLHIQKDTKSLEFINQNYRII